MAAVAYLDTHVAAWLYAGLIDRIPARARGLIETSELCVSPMVSLELQYLFEVKRTSEPANVVLQELSRAVGLSVCSESFVTVVEMALTLSWTRDPFDRIIVSQAALKGTALVTKDKQIRAHYAKSVWD